MRPPPREEGRIIIWETSLVSERRLNIILLTDMCVVSSGVCLLTDELPYIDVPLHTVIKLTPLAYGCTEERMTFGIEAVNTYIPRPQVSSYIASPSLVLLLSVILFTWATVLPLFVSSFRGR